MRLEIIILTLITTCYCKIEFSERARNFSIVLLYKTAEETNWHTVISPFGVWTLLSAVSLGAAGSTHDQLRKTLILPKSRTRLITGYKTLTRAVMKTGTPEVQLKSGNFLFGSTDYLIKNDFVKNIRNFQAIVNRLDFKSATAADTANGVIKKTGLKVTNVLHPDDFDNSKMILTNILTFKAHWRAPFNVSDTRVSPFYDSDGKTEIGQVNMMFIEENPPFSSYDEMKASVLELPYGDEEETKYSLLLILPDPGETVAQVYGRLADISLSDIFAKHKEDIDMYGMTPVAISVPRFHISTNLALNTPLMKMGITDMFLDTANFTNISDTRNLYVSSIVHNAVIEVTETGTVASATTYAYFADRARPSVFNANRPFIYFIVEKTTNTILFGGVYTKPSIF